MLKLAKSYYFFVLNSAKQTNIYIETRIELLGRILYFPVIVLIIMFIYIFIFKVNDNVTAKIVAS